MKLRSALFTLIAGVTVSGNLMAEPAISAPDTKLCPVDFHTVVLPDNAKQCQRFDVEMPATMIYFAPQSKADLIAYYQSTMPSLKVHSTFNGRTLLMAENQQIRVIVSPDSTGSQVDIMVTAPQETLITSL
ncbi:hypothetical protein CA267_004565 [Alteromonas pelagimontana]|uniref:Uncharacterized protein n=1 Tax=Alteromonas pelagimontana TaxID=1858656 RepID=A0A6M4MA76_9ALTE|nr:hypothetical protein [Alteromonas pelagimontana]QJR80101.1 hypothetical protein CA267_004565 [Alteromonas pelagimontana]